MGVGIFAARKIALLNRINNLEMMITQLSSQQMSLSDQAAQVAMNQNNVKINASNMQMGGQPHWTQAIGGIAGGVGMMVGGYTGQAIGQIGGGLGMLANSIWGNNGGGGMGGFNPTAQSAMLDNKLIEIQQKEKRLQTTMKRIESQLSMANKEYESVQKGEENAIQRSTPKFT